MQSSASDITPDNIAKTARIKKIQRISLLLLFLAGIINFLDRGSLSVANEAIRADLGLSATQFGVLLSAFSLSYGISQLPSGLLLDRFGPRIVRSRINFLVNDARYGRVDPKLLAIYCAAYRPWGRRSSLYAKWR